MLKECMMFFVIKSSGIKSTMENCSNTFLTTRKLPQVFNYCASPVVKRLCSDRENVQDWISKRTSVLPCTEAKYQESSVTSRQCASEGLLEVTEIRGRCGSISLKIHFKTKLYKAATHNVGICLFTSLKLKYF